ncbi:UPF0280 family protein [Roseovarius nubinhibens]|uniref:UPF0280 family protein n=1 Tax=Roseovarius nubinhibens TaxID=314263 RepID=UPI001C09FB1A|nr:UPF0280 family protein [Roseovarius nubinhibens]MBU3001631.1 UPF0280 family protein [Roseovarius nubinhibens]
MGAAAPERLHLQHGPIDLLIEAEPAALREAAFAAARRVFEGLLEALVEELPELRRAAPIAPVQGPVAQRMACAVAAHAEHGFVTPMAAVAGAVADEVLDAMRHAAPLSRAHVNNGGDIALGLAEGQSYRVAISSREGRVLGHVSVRGGDGVGGIATSGQGGRSLSCGIAESVTVLAATAADADVAATLIANAVDLPHHPRISRAPACDLAPDNDLGARLVVTGVPRLSGDEIEMALAEGAKRAERMLAEGRIKGAMLCLQGQARVIGSGAIAELEGHADVDA